MKTPIVITSLEEDFKKIGLIKAESVAPEASVEETDESELDEATRIKKRLQRKAGGGYEVKQLKKSSAKERMRGKEFRRSAAGKAAERLRGRVRGTKKFKKRAKKTADVAAQKGTRRGKGDMGGMRMKGDYGMGGMRMKGDYDMGMSMEAFDAAEALKSFANAAIIAERLQTVFTEWVKGDLCESVEDDTEFLKLAGELATIAEEFAEIATALSEGTEELDEEAVTALFNEGLETILDAVDLYEENEGEDDEDMEDEEEESDDEGND